MLWWYLLGCCVKVKPGTSAILLFSLFDIIIVSLALPAFEENEVVPNDIE